MSLLEKIEKDFKHAMQSKDSFRLIVLRDLRTALHNKEIELRPKEQELTDEIAIQVIQTQTKKRKEAIEMFEKGERSDLAEKEKKELELLTQYLPEQLSDNKIRAVVLEVIKESGASGTQDFGRVMGEAMKKLKGQVEGDKVKQVVQEQLSQL